MAKAEVISPQISHCFPNITLECPNVMDVPYCSLFRLSRHSFPSDGGPPRAPDGKLGIFDLLRTLILK